MVVSKDHWLGSEDDAVEVSEEALLEDYKTVIHEIGVNRFLYSKILLPSVDYFPDPWSPSADGVRVVTQRLLHYAGLSDYEARVELFDRLENDGAGGIFYGFENTTVHFGCNVSNLDYPESLIGTMGHEVAHAFRNQTGIVDDDWYWEELMTDMTSLCLGFGIFSCNSSRIYETSGEVVGASTVTTESVLRAGYIPPYLFAYLFAVQIVCRGMKRGEVAKITKRLRGCHREYFHEAYKDLKKRRPEILEALGIVLSDQPAPVVEVEEKVSYELNEPVAKEYFKKSVGLECRNRDCGEIIDHGLEVCPHCGGQQAGDKATVGLWVGAVMVIIFVLWLFWPF